ncbi:hypothetical protein EIN_273410 [Entamoeba invadens IP1]|uniref:Uncharacterized protein n=1 Tax=Entamoeba invadens IP1 TaxID=370355 RepID=A0A0A1U187_ENTIV|nr:hypothetical protein EIN_273410 [Entamoeba invadens IP1]ELP87814.1 hypothetical protein EIN_273410 [Entamoeba invadens IP1]|eukprot:XP_004254585.1 hypothetical protein EIN_273410 [Entamoeba invadens IP1]
MTYMVYCVNKAMGQDMSSSPIIDRLIYLRVLIERTKPIEKKLRYQIDKLLSHTKADEKLEAKPNIDELEVEKNIDGTFKPTTISGKAMETEGETTEGRKEKTTEDYMNEDGNEMSEELFETPDEVGVDGLGAFADKTAMRKHKEIEDIEEEGFKRTAQSKMDMKKKKNKLRNEFNELEDFVGSLKNNLMKEYKELQKIGIPDFRKKEDLDETLDYIKRKQEEEDSEDQPLGNPEDDDEEIDSDDI